MNKNQDMDPDQREEMRQRLENWEITTLKKALARSKERQKAFATESGIHVKRLYTPLDLSGKDYCSDLGFPGEFPYTRGVYPTMYRGRLWTMRQYAGFGTAEDTNKRFHYLLDHGMPGLSVAFDIPTQLGYDSDDPVAEGAVGRVGVAVDTLEDMEIIFDNIPLDKVSTSMTINAPATVLLAMYIAVGEKQGVPREKLTGTTQNDILVARALKDSGMEVVYTGLRQTPEQVANTAVQEDVDVLGMSFLSGDHMVQVPKVMGCLKEKGIDDILVVVGGIILRRHIPALLEMGVDKVFLPGTPPREIVSYIKQKVTAKSKK